MTKQKKIKVKNGWLFQHNNAGIFTFTIALGQRFQYRNDKFLIDETPVSDSNLVDINNISFKDGQYFEFDSFFRKNDTHFIIDCSEYSKSSELLVNFIKNVNEKNIILNESEDRISIDIDIEKQSWSVTFANKRKNKTYILDNNKYRRVFTLRFPEPMMEYNLISCKIKDGIVYIQTQGPDLDNKDINADPNELHEFQWELELQPELLNLVEGLINTEITNR